MQFKIQLLSHINHISSAHWACGQWLLWRAARMYVAVPSLPTDLLGSGTLELGRSVVVGKDLPKTIRQTHLPKTIRQTPRQVVC